MGKVHVAHAVTTKFLSSIVLFVALLYVSDYTRDEISAFIDDGLAYFVVIMTFVALILFYEGTYLRFFNKSQKTGSFAGYFFYGFAIMNIIIVMTTFLGLYDPFNDDGDINLVVQVIMGFDLIVLISAGLYEIAFEKRMALKNPLEGIF